MRNETLVTAQQLMTFEALGAEWYFLNRGEVYLYISCIYILYIFCIDGFARLIGKSTHNFP